MSGDAAIDGISGVLAAASSGGSGASTVDAGLGTSDYVPTVDEMLVMGAQDIAEPSPKRKRGRPKGSRNNSRSNSPAPDDGLSGEEMTRAYASKMGAETAADKRAVLLRKKIHKIFDYFPHKLSKYYSNIPNVAAMSVQQLIDTEQLLLSIIDETDESIYVKECFKMTARFIESTGPAIQQRFLRWMPGSEVLQFQDGLGDTVDEMVDVPGDEGIGDEVNRISLDFVGWAPSNPYANAGIKLFRIMQAVKTANVEEMNTVKRTPSEEDGL